MGRLSRWINDHRTQAVVGVVVAVSSLLVAVVALARDYYGLEHPRPSPVPAASAASAASEPVVRRGPMELRMSGDAKNETEIDLDSLAKNWGVNRCGSKCDLNFRTERYGVEQAYGEMAALSADHHSCTAATTYGFTLGPRQARPGVELCVLTDEQRSAGLRVERVERSAPDKVQLIVFTVTVWEK